MLNQRDNHIEIQEEMLTQKYLNDLTYSLIGCAIEVHKELGPGLLESIYHKCYLAELFARSIQYNSHLNVPVIYKGRHLETELKLDVLVEDVIVVELKAVELLHPLYDAQLLTYMKLLHKPKGLLVNFNCTNIFKEGQKTIVNELFAALPKQ